MADFDAQIRRRQDKVAAALAKPGGLAGRTGTARRKLKAGDDNRFDIENAALDDVRRPPELTSANIAGLLMGLGDVTAGFLEDFDELRSKTGPEILVGIFSQAKSESLRQERLRMAAIAHRVQDPISRSDAIVKLPTGQPDVQDDHKVRVEANLTEPLDGREAVLAEREAVRGAIAGMDPRLLERENRSGGAQDAAARARPERELARLDARHAAVRREQVKPDPSQTPERHIEKGKTWIESLQNRAATRMVRSSTPQTDTRQRAVLCDALTKSLKTARQQEVARRITEIGVGTDKEAQAAMAAIGTATNDRLAEMKESQEAHMVFARRVPGQRAKADERFARRFGPLVEKHDRNLCGGLTAGGPERGAGDGRDRPHRRPRRADGHLRGAASESSKASPGSSAGSRPRWSRRAASGARMRACWPAMSGASRARSAPGR